MIFKNATKAQFTLTIATARTHLQKMDATRTRQITVNTIMKIETESRITMTFTQTKKKETFEDFEAVADCF